MLVLEHFDLAQMIDLSIGVFVAFVPPRRSAPSANK